MIASEIGMHYIDAPVSPDFLKGECMRLGLRYFALGTVLTLGLKKEACDKPTPQGFKCTFDVKVASRNIGASMYNNIPFGEFYKDKESGKWMMRPPF